MKKLARKIVAVVCAFSLLMGTGAVPVLAEETEQKGSLTQENSLMEIDIEDKTESAEKDVSEDQIDVETIAEINDDRQKESIIDIDEAAESTNEDDVLETSPVDGIILDAGNETVQEEQGRDAEDPYEDSIIDEKSNDDTAVLEANLKEQPDEELNMEEEASLVSATSNIVICGVDIGIAPGTFMQFQTSNGTNSNSGYYYKGYYLAASQCFGFARWCQYKLFGYHSASSGNDFYRISANGISSIAAGNLTTTNLKSMIQASKIGAHLRTNPNSSGTAHSLVITDISDTGFSIAQCNGSNNNEYSSWKQNYVGTYTYTWSSYVSSTYGKRGIAYIELPESYPYDYSNEPPTNLSISTDKKNYKVGENVTFSFSSNNATTLAIPIDVNGKREFFNYVNGQNSYTQSFNVPGVYGYFLYGYNDAGQASSEYKEFYVYNEKPKDLTINIDKTEYEVGEEVTFTFSSKYAKRLAIPIDVNGKREFFNIVTDQNSYKQSFNVPGVYGFFLHGNNEYGEASSEYKEFYVYNEAPKDLTISTDKDKYSVGEKVTFTFSSKYTKSLAIPIDVNGKREFFNHVEGTTTYTQSFNVPGTYGYFLYGTNSFGEGSSEYKEFTVSAKLPEDLRINTDKNEYAVGEEVKFTFSAKNVKTLAIPIDVNGKREFFNYVEGSTSYRQSFNVPGTYGYFLYGTNDYGNGSSEYKEFYVYNEKPKDLKIKVEKEKYSVDENVVFIFSGKYAKTLAIPIDVNDKREFFIHVDGQTTYKQSFKVPGKYGYFLYGNNEYGDNSSEYKLFYIVDKLSSAKTTINLSQLSYKYDGTVKKPGVTVKQGEITLKEGTDYSVTYSNNLNVGTASVTITGKGNYTGIMSKSFTISAASLDGAEVSGITGKTYSGTAQTQNLTVKLGGKTLTNGTDYTLSYANNTNAGTATMTITGKGNYTGKVNKTFTISAASLAGAEVSGISGKTYNGSAQTQNLTVKLGGKTLTNGTDYTLSYANNTNAGTATVTITGKGNYTGKVSKTFTISAASLTGAEVSGITGKTYNGSAQTQSLTVKVGGKTLTNGTDYTLSYANNTNGGTATVTITGKGNYNGTVSKTFTISAVSLAGAEVSGIAGRTYNGAAQTQNPTVKVGGRTLTNGTDYTLSYANNTNAGTATLTIIGKSNYTGTISKAFTISAASLSGAEVSGIAGRTYNGSAQTQSPTVKVGGKTLTNGTDYTLSYANNTNAGTATLTITGKGNYNGTVSKNFTISQAVPKLSFASEKVEKTTLSAPFTNTFSKTTDGTVGFTSGNTNVAVVDNSGKVTIKGVGTTTITAIAAAGKNYKAGSASYTLTVVDGRTDITSCKVTLSPTSYTYDGAVKKPAVTVKNGTTALTNGTDYTVAYANNTNAGTATVTVTGKGSYAGTVTATFPINRRSLSDASVSGIANKTYNGAAQTQNPAVKAGDRTLANGTDYTLSYANNTNAGNATVTIAGKGNYSGSISKTFTISQAAPKLSFASAKVEKTTLSAAFTNALTKTTDGTVTFKSGDTKVAVVDSASGKVTVKGIGTTTITATAAAGKNYKAGSASYTLTVVDGRTDIAGCTVSLSPASYTYDGTAKKPAVTVKNGTATLTNGADYTAAYKNNTNAGTATVTVTGKGNYAGTITATFTINRRSLSDAVVSGIANKTYKGSAQTQSPTVKVGDRTLANGTDYTLSYANNTNAGNATVTIAGKGNYSGSISKTFTISQAAPKLSFASAKVEKTTLSAAFTNALTKTTDGTVTFKSGDTKVAVVDSASGKVTVKGIGTTTITATAAAGKNYKAGSANYTVTVVDGRTDIAGCTVSLSPTSYTYDGTAKKPAVTVKNGTATLTNGTDYTAAYKNNTNAGTATVTVTGKGNYAGTVSKTFKINRRSIAAASVTGLSDKTYNGSEQTQDPVVKVAEKTLTSGNDYTISYENNVNAGAATLKISGKGNYTGTKSVEFTINKAAPTLKFAKSSLTKVETDAAFTNKLTVTTDGTVTYKSSNTGVAAVNKTSGKVTIKGTGKTTITATAAEGTNYKAGSAKYTLTVTASGAIKSISLSETSITMIYGKEKDVPDVTYSPESATDEKTVDWTSSNEKLVTVSGGKIKAMDPGKAVITATVPGSKVSASANVRVLFTDVTDAGSWYFDAVYWALDNNVTSGYGKGTFKPTAGLTRAQTVTFLYNLAGKPNVDGLTAQEFTDVKSSDWYYPAVKWAAANKITSGYGQGTFRPDATCTRAMIVSFLMSYAKLTGTYMAPASSANFPDVPPSAWYKAAVDWAVENGITKGYGSGTFSPDVTCNRAMMVTFLKKTAELPKVY